MMYPRPRCGYLLVYPEPGETVNPRPRCGYFLVYPKPGETVYPKPRCGYPVLNPEPGEIVYPGSVTWFMKDGLKLASSTLHLSSSGSRLFHRISGSSWC